jgi:amino acid transporter
MGGLIVHYIPSFIVITFPPSSDVYSLILDVEGYPRQFFSIALCSGLIWLRYKRPDLKRPFKAWLSAVVPLMAMSIALLVAPFFPPKEQAGNIFYATYAIIGVGM